MRQLKDSSQQVYWKFLAAFQLESQTTGVHLSSICRLLWKTSSQQHDESRRRRPEVLPTSVLGWHSAAGLSGMGSSDGQRTAQRKQRQAVCLASQKHRRVQGQLQSCGSVLQGTSSVRDDIVHHVHGIRHGVRFAWEEDGCTSTFDKYPYNCYLFFFLLDY